MSQQATPSVGFRREGPDEEEGRRQSPGSPIPIDAGHAARQIDDGLDRLLAATGADAAELFLAAPAGEELVLAFHRGSALRAFRQITAFQSGFGFPGLVARTSRPLVSLDLPHDDRYLRTEVKRRGFRSYLCVPVDGGARLLGSLHVASVHRDVDVDLRSALLAEAAQGLGSTLEIARHRVAEPIAGLLADPGADAAEDLWRTADLVLRRLMELASAARGALLLPGGESPVMEPVVDLGWAPRRRAPGASCDATLCSALLRRWPRFQGEVPGIPGPECAARPRDFATTLCLPLEAGGKSLGIAALGWERPDPLPTRHLSFLHTTLRAGAVALHNALVAFRRERAARRLLSSPPVAGAALDGVPAAAGRRAEAGAEVPRLYFRCLGPFKILVNGRESPAGAFRRRQPLTLLKVLLSHHGKPVHREQLVEILWPEELPSSADSLLNLAVHRLRRDLEQLIGPGQPHRFVVRSSDSYLIDPGFPHRVDTHEFMGAAERAGRLEAEGRPGEALEAYLRAAGLYGGDFLEEEPYSDWCAPERERLRRRFVEVVGRIVRLHLAGANPTEAMAWCRRALALDETLEEFHRALMEALWRAGRRDEAVRQYHLCRAALERELDVAPDTATTALYRRIAAEDPPEHCPPGIEASAGARVSRR